MAQNVTNTGDLMNLTHEEQLEVKRLLCAHHDAIQETFSREITVTRTVNHDEHSSTRNLIQTENTKAVSTLLTELPKATHTYFTTEQDRERFLRSLDFPEIDARQEDISDIHTKTFEWIFDESDRAMRPWDNFVNWLKCADSIYWINGKAGSGKSTLMNFICCDERTKTFLGSWRPGVVVLKFFFWRAGSPLQRSICGLLRSFLYQLLSSDKRLADQLLTSNPELRRKDLNAHWSEKLLHKLFETSIHLHQSPICIFLDGIDEFDPDEGNLLELIQYWDSITDVKLCVSSRPEDLESFFRDRPRLRLQDLTRGDIAKLVNDLLLENTDVRNISRRENKPIHLLTDAILRDAEGVFLWVSLVTKSFLRGIKNQDSWSQLRQRLEAFPKGLYDLYRHMWSRLNEDEPLYRKEAALWFRIALSGVEHFRSGQHSLFHSVTAASTEFQAQILEADTLPPLQKIVEECTFQRRRLPLISAGLLEVRDRVPESNLFSGGDWAKPASCRLLGFLADERNDNWSVQQRESWKNIAHIHRTTDVSFIHRSAVDFLSKTAEGKLILSAEPEPNITIFCRMVGADLVLRSLHVEVLNKGYFDDVFSNFNRLVEKVGSKTNVKSNSELSAVDIPETLYAQGMKIVTEAVDLEDPCRWFQILPSTGPRICEERDFLSLAFSHSSTLSLSQWIIDQVRNTSFPDRSCFLGCAATNGRLDGVRIMLENGADPNLDCRLSTSRLNSWNAFLSSLWEKFLVWGSPPDDDLNIAHEFLNHGADLDEIVLFTVDKDGFTWCETLIVGVRRFLESGILITVSAAQLLKAISNSLHQRLEPLELCWTRTILFGDNRQFWKPKNQKASEILTNIIESRREMRSDAWELLQFESIIETLGNFATPLTHKEAFEYLGLENARPAARREWLREYFEKFANLDRKDNDNDEMG